MESSTVLDHIENITVPGKPFEQPANEYWALLCLWYGIESLYQKALRCDQLMKQHVPPNLISCAFGGLPSTIPEPLLVCWFQWYAISACQYVRVVGAIAHQQDCAKPKPLDYVAKVIPEVLRFRDKVAAHYAWSGKNKNDNDAERLASIMPPIHYWNGSFHVNVWSVGTRRGGQQSFSEGAPWSICEVHERLRARYWPNPNPVNHG